MEGTGSQTSCMCPAGFSGNICEIDLDFCRPDSCFDGGLCVEGRGMATNCNCSKCFNGSRCGNEISVICTDTTLTQTPPSSSVTSMSSPQTPTDCDLVDSSSLPPPDITPSPRTSTNLPDFTSTPDRQFSSLTIIIALVAVIVILLTLLLVSFAVHIGCYKVLRNKRNYHTDGQHIMVLESKIGTEN